MSQMLIRAFCQWRARQLVEAAERWLSLEPESPMMQQFCDGRVERLTNAAGRWLRWSLKMRTLAR